MIEGLRWSGIAALVLVGACDGNATAPVEAGGGDTATVSLNRAEASETEDPAQPAPRPAQADGPRYTSIDPDSCRLIEQNIEEGGYSRHACNGAGGYKLEISESDLRQDVVVIAPGGSRSALELSSSVAKGAFNSLGKKAEWRGPEASPTALIVRLNVARGPEPTRPDISNLVVARLARPVCVVAVVPPGPDQNVAARQVADDAPLRCRDAG